MRILVTDGMDKGAIEKVRAMGHELVEQFYEPAELGKALRDFDVAIIRSKTKLRAKQIDEAKGSRFKCVIRAGVGLDNIDVQYAKDNGIEVKNTPKSPSESVAELAMAQCSPAPVTSPSPATPCARASGRRRPTARASS